MTVRLRILVANEAVDVESGRLWAEGAVGIEEQPVDDARTALVAAFTEPTQLAAFPGAVIVGDDVRAGVRPYATTSRIGRFVIAPPWELAGGSDAARPNGTIALSIDPGEAFGHGAHPTTRLMLTLLGEMDLRGRTVADIGCGTGVVAVAAAALGASAVIAVDNDPAAIDAARGNVAANRFADRVEVLEGDAITFERQVDVAAVNVTIDVHEQTAAVVARRASDSIVAGGVLDEQRDRLIGAYPDFAVRAGASEGEWHAVELVRSGSAR